jgi:glutamine amidotransferase
MIAIIDYGVGNLFSLSCSLKKIGAESVITSDANVIKNAQSIILPGVGAFGDAAQKLQKGGMADLIKDLTQNGKPLLGICLGMQMLFDRSFEYGTHNGLGLISGEVCPLEKDITKLKIPHMGWNSLDFKKKDSKILKYINDGDYVYFVHSYYAKCDERYLSATSHYGIDVAASVENGNVYGTQFHPEKSGEVGLKILQAFAEIGEKK